MSSQDGFFDVLFLGVFIILAPALDPRIFEDDMPPNLLKEIALAESSFQSLLHLFTKRYFIMLDGEVISYKYIFHRLLAELAAATVTFAKQVYNFAMREAAREPSTANDDDLEEEKRKYSFLKDQISSIIKQSYPEVLDYYLMLCRTSHESFHWSDYTVWIFPRLKDVELLLSTISRGELVDLPGFPIYHSPTGTRPVRRDRGSSTGEEDSRPKKRQC